MLVVKAAVQLTEVKMH